VSSGAFKDDQMMMMMMMMMVINKDTLSCFLPWVSLFVFP